MARRCKKCDYGDFGDMCRFWRVWKKEVPMRFCSEEFVAELKKENVVKYNVFNTPTRINDFNKFHEIGKRMFPKW